MPNGHPKSRASIAGHPIHPMLIPFPIAFLISAFVADLIFWATTGPAWANAAMWLLGLGVVMALVVAAFGFTDFVLERRIRALGHAWQHMVGNLVVVLLAALNWFVRYSSGAPDAALPYGILLSFLTVLLLSFTG